METITGRVRGLAGPFTNDFMVLDVEPHGKIVGCLPGLEPGDFCRFEGKWVEHSKFGRQFRAANAVVETPKDEQGLYYYLERHFPWIGPAVAKTMVKTFEKELFDVFEHEPGRLTEVKGITPDRATEIHETYMKVKADLEADSWFASHDISLAMLKRILKRYQNKQLAMSAIKSNPYRLADLIDGIGFKRADEIAGMIGVDRTSKHRLNAGALWTLKEAGEKKGHCFLPQDQFNAIAAKLLGVNHTLFNEAVDNLLEAEKMYSEEGALYLADLKTAEDYVAHALTELARAPHEAVLNNLTKDDLIKLDADQQKALELALKSKVLIITGGPGVGKSYTVDAIIQALGFTKEDNRLLRLAAPTGKAAKRMVEMTGMTAETIHRLLEFHPELGFRRNEDNLLIIEGRRPYGNWRFKPIRTIIIDESSMVDIRLMASFLKAVHPATQVIFVGDVDQLPSVGPGRVLKDMIDAGIPTARLQTLHRQAAESNINLNAKKINAGKPLKKDDFGKDFWFVPVKPHKDPSKEVAQIPELIIRAIEGIMENLTYQAGDENRAFTEHDIQILCPMKKSAAGTTNLNDALRAVLNPQGQKLRYGTFWEGDRIIQLRNNYDLEVFNGDIGRVVGSDRYSITVAFEDVEGERLVAYPLEDAQDLALAYALTIHKSQGSEFPCVIMPVHTTHYIMLKRNLLYTGITRGKKMVVLVGTMKAINIAINTMDSDTRFSHLKEKILEALNPQGSEVSSMGLS